MPYFNVSYTENNPYDNTPAWGDGSTMSGIFFLNGISLGIDRLTTQYDNRFIAPGGQYVTWSAPFNLNSSRYALYTNSYLQGITSEKRNIENYVNPFPICFESSELTGSTSSDIQILKSLFLKQQSVGSPMDYSTVFPVISNPNETFENILKCYGDVNFNSHANEYLVTNTYGDYEYLAIWKWNLSTLLDFGWEASVSRSFHNNPQDGTLANIATTRKIDLQIFDTSYASFFSNEKYGYVQLSSSGANGPAYLRNLSAITDDINGKYKISVGFWIDSTVSQPDSQVIFHMVSGYDVSGSKNYRTFLKVTLDKNTNGLIIDFESQYLKGVDTTTTTATNLASAPTFIQICIDANRSDQPYNLIVYQDDKQHHTFDFEYNNGYDFQGIDHYFFLGVESTTDTTDPPQATATNPSYGIRLHTFYLWTDDCINSDIAFQNYWLTKQRYS